MPMKYVIINKKEHSFNKIIGGSINAKKELY